MHCRSFYKRFLGMREALFLSGVDYEPGYSILEKDTFPYADPHELAALLSEKKRTAGLFYRGKRYDYHIACGGAENIEKEDTRRNHADGI